MLSRRLPCFELKISLHQLEYTFIIAKVVNIYPSGLGVSIHNKSSLGQVHLYYCLSDKYVINVAYMFQVITSLHQLEYSFIIA